MTQNPPDSRPIHSQSLILAAVAAGVLLTAMYLTTSIIEDETGGIGATVRTLGAGLALLAFIRPKAGLYIITLEAFSVDFIKKVAVYYGTVSINTIIEVLVVTMLAVAGTIGGVLIQSVALRRYKIAPLNWGLLLGAAVIGVAILLADLTADGFAKAGENAFNAAVFIALAIPMTIFLADRAELHKLLKVQFWCAVVWSAWGIKQYYTGFTPLEWFYAETGLSAVASEHMLKFANPRPFGFGSGSPNYGVIAPYFIYGVWLLSQYRRGRSLYFVGTAVVFWGLVTSQQRTALLLPLIVLAFYFGFRTKTRTIVMYASAATLFVLGVAFNQYLLDHIGDINNAISFKGDWAESVLNVGTYSDRLYSWDLLKNPSTYSLFGTRDNVFTHDIFSRIIIAYGVVGLTVVLAAAGTVAWFLHRTLLRVADPEDRKFATFLLAATVPYLALGFAGGGNFTTNPTNLQIWTFFGAAVSLAVNSKLVAPAPKAPVLTLRGLLAQQIPSRVAGLRN